MYDLIIQNGRLVTSKQIEDVDIAVRDGKIAAIVQRAGNRAEAEGRSRPGEGEAPRLKAAARLDASGKLIFPGLVDCHSHFQVPGFTHRENFETGSRAAAVSGVTTVIDMPLNNEPPIISRKAFLLKQEQVAGQSYVDYGFWGGYVDDNYSELEALYESGAVAFKSFLSPVKEGDFTSVNLWQVKQGMKKLKELGSLLGLHCEDYTLLYEGKKKALSESRYTVDDFLEVHSITAEKIAVANVIELCREIGARTHICHVSHPDVAELIRKAIAEGLPVTAETCPHYLGFTDETLKGKKSVAKCTPPLRDRAASERLWDYVLDGTLSCIGSDHSPAMPEEKDDSAKTIWEAWGGLNSVQFLLPFMYHQAVHLRGLSPTVLASAMSENPAKVFGLYPQKGSVQIGADADLVILDPERKWKVTEESIHTMHKITVFIGEEGMGFPVCTLLRGKITAEEGMYVPAAKGMGRFLVSSNESRDRW